MATEKQQELLTALRNDNPDFSGINLSEVWNDLLEIL
jgi:hypothetical protein